VVIALCELERRAAATGDQLTRGRPAEEPRRSGIGVKIAAEQALTESDVARTVIDE
jgi:hypothetical protein